MLRGKEALLQKVWRVYGIHVHVHNYFDTCLQFIVFSFHLPTHMCNSNYIHVSTLDM